MFYSTAAAAAAAAAVLNSNGGDGDGSDSFDVSDKNRNALHPLLFNLKLASTGQPDLITGEILRKLQPHTKMRTSSHGEHSWPVQDAVVYVTSHRLCWVWSQGAVFLQIEKITDCQQKTAFLQSKKLLIKVSGGEGDIVLAFKEGMTAVAETLTQSLKSKAWIPTEKFLKPTKPNASEEKNVAAAVGMQGVLKMVEAQQQHTEQVVSEAFADLDSLMVKAKEMVLIAEKISSVNAKNEKDKEKDEFASMLVEFGVVCPVTKEATGLLFHQELAKQLALFLPKPLQRAGGVLTLPDVFCIYNRARGTDLISPEDLLRACQMFESLKLPIVLRKYKSGVLVVEMGEHNNEEGARKAADHLNVLKCASAIQMASAMKASLVLTKELLLEAENLGLVCRDDTMEGLVFYPNKFNEYVSN